MKYNIGAVTDRDSVAGKGIYTEQYPKVRPDVAPRFHGAPRLNMDPETHETLCIACNLCALACPEDCIDVSRWMLRYGRRQTKKKEGVG